MKEFDLEKAKAGEKLVTRQGKEAHFIAYIPELREYHRLLVRVEEELIQYCDDGYYFHNKEIYKNDLFMKLKEYTVRDGVITEDQKVWWHGAEGPECVSLGDNNHKENLLKYPNIYSIEKPKFKMICQYE